MGHLVCLEPPITTQNISLGYFQRDNFEPKNKGTFMHTLKIELKICFNEVGLDQQYVFCT